MTVVNTTTPSPSTTNVNATIGKRQGIFGNIRTSPLGDANYGAFAAFRGRRAA